MDTLLELLTAVRNNRRFWPDEATFQMVHQILPVPATEVAVVQGGKLLLQYRTFAEWPEPYNKPGWYIPGGYVPWSVSLDESCNRHLAKDLKGKHTGPVPTLSLPTVIAVKKWMPDEHPFGCPVSLVCVCELLEGDIPETDTLTWASCPIETDVPHHHTFQKMVFAWLNATDEQRVFIKTLQSM